MQNNKMGDSFALPTGTIWLSQVNTELGHTSNRGIWLGNSDVRALAGKPSGAISMNDLRGKSNALPSTFTKQPADVSILIGQTATFTAAATNPEGTPEIRWYSQHEGYKNSGSTLTITNASTYNTQDIWAMARFKGRDTKSRVASLKVTAPPPPPTKFTMIGAKSINQSWTQIGWSAYDGSGGKGHLDNLPNGGGTPYRLPLNTQQALLNFPVIYDTDRFRITIENGVVLEAVFEFVNPQGHSDYGPTPLYYPVITASNFSGTKTLSFSKYGIERDVVNAVWGFLAAKDQSSIDFFSHLWDDFGRTTDITMTWNPL